MLAASDSTRASVNPSAAITTCTSGRPSVSVPVLSTTSVSTFSISSSASASLMSTPSLAPRPTPTMIDTGVARPSAHGHAMMSTDTATSSAFANAGAGPTSAQPAKAANAIAMTASTNQPDTWSASFWIGARERPASATSWTMRASSVSAPTRSARIRNAPVWLTVPPVTRLPTDFSAGIGSPEIIDSSTLERPSVTTPSTGIFAPGFTRRTSPTTTASSATADSVPSGPTRSAVSGTRFSRSSMAPDVRARARSSSTCPSRASATITAAASK